MNPYSFNTVREPLASGSRQPSASRIALGSFIAMIVHLAVFAGWVIYDLYFAPPQSGCFTGDGFLELLILVLSFTCFSAVTLWAAIKSRRWWIAVATGLCLTPAIYLACSVISIMFF